VATAATTVTAIVAAMALIPTYAFTTATEAPSSAVGTLPASPVIPQVPTPVSGVVIADPADLVRSLLLIGIVSLLVIGAAGVTASWVVAGRVLSPLTDLNEAARRAAGGNLHHRVRLSEADDEFRALGETFDDMLDRLERSFDANERFAANASHELRTPLATTRLLLDLASRDTMSADDTAELLGQIRTMNERAVDIVNALLQLADSSSAPPDLDEQELAPVLDEAATEVAPLAAHLDVDLELRSEPGTARIDKLLMRQAVTNLIRNAVQSNIPGGHVWVSATTTEHGWSITVENTGTAVSATELARLHEPFYRVRGRSASPGVPGTGDSHGLGLALVGRIVERHGGTLGIESRTAGGLVVRMSLPHATPLAVG